MALLRNYCVRPRTYGPYSACCNGVVYNRSASVCCRGVQDIVGDYTACCGGLLYSPTHHLCCPDNIPRYKTHGVYTRCCGSTVYDYRERRCCNDQVRRCNKRFNVFNILATFFYTLNVFFVLSTFLKCLF